MSPVRPPRLPAIRYRPARRTDVETLADLEYRAYRVSSVEKRREFFLNHPRFTLRDVRVAELDGEIAAALVLYPLTAHVCGEPRPVVGVGSVAVSPEHRRRGVAEAAMRAALREMRQDGRALSMLYPFRVSFYRKFGYGVIESVHLFTTPASNFPSSDQARRVRRLRPPDRPHVQELYDRLAPRINFALARKPEWWEQRLWTYPGEWVVYEGKRRGQIEGYLYYEVTSAGGPFKLAITILEMLAASAEAHRGLLGHVATLADQVAEVQVAAPSDGVMMSALRTANTTQPRTDLGAYSEAAGLHTGAMLRLVDVKAALEMRPVGGNGRGVVNLEVEDEVLPQNARALGLSVREGRFHVGNEAGRRAPRLRCGVDVLAQIYGGALSPVAAARAGLAVATGNAAELAEPWFRCPPAFVFQLNAF
jgi:predicted acetyltransferase